MAISPSVTVMKRLTSDFALAAAVLLLAFVLAAAMLLLAVRDFHISRDVYLLPKDCHTSTAAKKSKKKQNFIKARIIPGCKEVAVRPITSSLVRR